MANAKFKAKIDHTEKTIEELFRTEYYTYEKSTILLRLGIGVAAAVVGIVVVMPIWCRGILLLIAGWLIAAKDFPSQVRADKAVQDRNGILPKMSYEFYEGYVTVSGEGSMNIQYKKFKRLVKDANYLYMFISKDSVCMLERESVKPKSDAELMDFVAQKTGQEWKSEKSFLLLNIYDIRDMFRDRKAR